MCSVFMDQFSDFLIDIYKEYTNIIIVGDFNIHWNIKDDRNTVQFQDLLTAFNLVQYVNCSSHNSGNTIDFIITREEFKFHLTEPENVFPISDHGIIKILIDISKPQIMKQDITYRKLNSIDHSKLSTDLQRVVETLDSEMRSNVLVVNVTMN